jgi:hypothetical protein
MQKYVCITRLGIRTYNTQSSFPSRFQFRLLYITYLELLYLLKNIYY